jgi:hypothetical protein
VPPPDLVKLPKPSDDIWKLPTFIIKEPKFKDVFGSSGSNPSGGSGKDNFPDNWFAGAGGGEPSFKEKIRKLLTTGAIANYNKIFALIFRSSQSERRTITQDPKMIRLIKDSFSSKPELVTPIVASLLTGEQRWSNTPNDLISHFLYENTEKALSFNATMNCWEMILYAAFICGQISGKQIKNFLESTYPTGRQMTTMGYSRAPELPFYPTRKKDASSPTKYPQPGDLVYFTDGTPFPGHVAISLFGSLVVSLWEFPDLRDGKNNRIQIIDINDLPGRVQIGPPLTEAIKAGKI